MLIFQNSDENDWKDKPNLHLSIEVSETYLTLLLWDESEEKTLGLEEFLLSESSIDNELNKSIINSNSTPKTTSCIQINSSFTLIPSPIFKQENISEYLNFNTKQKNNFSNKSSKLLKHEIFNCYKLNIETEKIITENFPNTTFKPLENILIDSSQNGLNINFSSENTLEILYLKENELVFCNNFSFKNKEEVMYFISLVSEKLNLNLETEKVFLTGKIEKNKSIFNYLKEFITENNLIFTTNSDSLEHKYHSLFKQFKCV